MSLFILHFYPCQQNRQTQETKAGFFFFFSKPKQTHKRPLCTCVCACVLQPLTRSAWNMNHDPASKLWRWLSVRWRRQYVSAGTAVRAPPSHWLTGVTWEHARQEPMTPWPPPDTEAETAPVNEWMWFDFEATMPCISVMVVKIRRSKLFWSAHWVICDLLVWSPC